MGNKGVFFLCPLCKGQTSNQSMHCRDYLTNVEGWYTYKRCSTCGSYIQSPIPTHSFLVECYSTQNLGYKKPPLSKPDSSTAKFLITQLENIKYKLIDKISPIIRTINLIPITPPPARVLEIGCSHGLYLQHLKDVGYEVVGIDLSEESIEYARKRGLDAECKSIENCSYPENSFNIVVMSMVLEHLQNPEFVIQQISKWLVPEGELLFSVPCSDGFEFKRYMEYCYVVHPPYHIFIPSIIGLRVLLEPYFEVKFIGFQAFHRDLLASASFKKEHDDNISILDSFFNTLSKSETLKVIVRTILMLYVLCGGRTSRVSVRCNNKK